MHCYFILAGNAAVPIVYHVDIVREGRSFQTRSVQARQKGRCIFTTTISFQVPVASDEDPEGLPPKKVATHALTKPDGIPGPEECENELGGIERLLKEGRIDEEIAEFGRKQFSKEPFEWRRIRPASSPSSSPFSASTSNFRALPPAERKMRSWVRCKQPPTDDAKMHYAVLAYVTDSWFIGTVGRVNPDAHMSKIGMMVSLDHTIHFHAPGGRLRVDEGWLLVENQSTWAGEERGYVLQKIWDESGALVASCTQEGMVRLKDGREGENEGVAEREGSKL